MGLLSVCRPSLDYGNEIRECTDIRQEDALEYTLMLSGLLGCFSTLYNEALKRLLKNCP